MQNKIFLITYHAKPNKTFEDYEDFGGAHVNCWIEESSAENAEKIAQKEIEEYNWHVKTLDEIIEVDEEFYSEEDPKRQYFEQALLDKVVMLFYTYPRKT